MESHPMPASPLERKLEFDELKPGDRIEVEHVVTVGARQWTTRTRGTVVRIERRRHGLHFRRNFDDKVYSDSILLELPDGELTAVTVDEFTVVRPMPSAQAEADAIAHGRPHRSG